MKPAPSCLPAFLGAFLVSDVALAKRFTPPKSFVHDLFDADHIDPEWANLQPFLDPDASGAVSLPGKDHADVPGVPAVSAWGRALLIGLLLVAGGWTIRRPERRVAAPRAF